MTQLGHGEVSEDRIVLAHLEVAHAEFFLLIFESPLHGPATEGDVQDGFEGGAGMSVAKEVFFFARLQNIACVDEPIGAEDLPVATNPQGGRFDFPNHRPLFGVLEVDALPRLPQHDA